MNFLAHLHLAPLADSLLLGNLLADFVRGNVEAQWPQPVVAGIALHRRIDVLTDNLPEVRSARQLFRAWPRWRSADGELTAHGYAAVVNKGRWQAEHYRQLGLLRAGCPDAGQIYVRASPLQRTRATAQALLQGAFPGCDVVVHHVAGTVDPLFQSEKLPFGQTDAATERAAVAARAGDLAALQQLRQAVCAANCPFFDRPWQLKQSKNGHTYVQGFSVLASMAETLRLG